MRYVEDSVRAYRAKHGSSAARRLDQSLNNDCRTVVVDKPLLSEKTEGIIVTNIPIQSELTGVIMDKSKLSVKTAGDAIKASI